MTGMIPEGRWLPGSLTPEYRPDDAPAAHAGIVLRVSIPAGPLVQADSMVLHWQARYAGSPVGGWHEVLRTTDGLLIEVSPVMLAEAPDDDEPEPADLDPRGDREDAEQYGYEPGGDKR